MSIIVQTNVFITTNFLVTYRPSHIQEFSTVTITHPEKSQFFQVRASQTVMTAKFPRGPQLTLGIPHLVHDTMQTVQFSKHCKFMATTHQFLLLHELDKHTVSTLKLCQFLQHKLSLELYSQTRMVAVISRPTVTAH